MRTLLRRFVRDVRRFGAESKAVAVVEFALVLPVLLVLYMGTIEVSDLIAVDRRVNVISGTMGDLVARADTCIRAADVTDYFRASEGIIVPYNKSGLKQVVTLLKVSSGGVATVDWSQPYGGATARTKNAVYPLPPAMVAISAGKSVVLSETSYAYRPLLGLVVKSAINLHRVSYFMPRESTTITYKATGNC